MIFSLSLFFLLFDDLKRNQEHFSFFSFLFFFFFVFLSYSFYVSLSFSLSLSLSHSSIYNTQERVARERVSKEGEGKKKGMIQSSQRVTGSTQQREDMNIYFFERNEQIYLLLEVEGGVVRNE